MPELRRITLDVADGIGTLTLNRPDRLNAFDVALCRELLDAFRTLLHGEGVRVIILTGAGRGFCAGADLQALERDGPALVRHGKDIALLVRSAPVPVIAAVNGAAAGGGVNLALACDYRIAADTATLGEVFHKLGIGPDWGGSYFLPRLVGRGRALELLWSARMVPAAEALTLGLVDRVVPADRLLDEARALARVWAGFPPLALRRAKELIDTSARASLEEMLDLEIAVQDELFATPEARERLGALTARSR